MRKDLPHSQKLGRTTWFRSIPNGNEMADCVLYRGTRALRQRNGQRVQGVSSGPFARLVLGPRATPFHETAHSSIRSSIPSSIPGDAHKRRFHEPFHEPSMIYPIVHSVTRPPNSSFMNLPGCHSSKSYHARCPTNVHPWTLV